MPRLRRDAVVIAGFSLATAATVAVVSYIAAQVGPVAAIVAAAAVLGAIVGGVGVLIMRANRMSTRQVRKSNRVLTELSKELSATTKRVAAIKRAVAKNSAKPSIDQLNHLVGVKLTELGKAGERSMELVERRLEKAEGSAQWDFRQMEALINLHAVVDVRGVMPMSRGFAASPDVILAYVSQILRSRPSLVVECGSGLSTLWAGYAAERYGGRTRVVALEDQEQYAAATTELIRAHGLEPYVEVRHAPLQDVEIGGELHRWYAPAKVEDLQDVGVLFVDGPAGYTASHARYPAVPLLRDALAPGAVVIVDDAARAEEAEMVELWRKEWPEVSADQLTHEKGTVLLRVPD